MEKKSTHIRKEEIMQAALEVIGTKGVRAMTIAAIAETAGMSEANIYRHFGGKDDIYAALADFIGSAIMGRAATIAGSSRKPVEKLETIYFSHIALLAEHPGIPRFVFSEDIHLGHPGLSETLMQSIGSYVETITGIIAAGIEEGEFRAGLAPRESAVTMLGMIQFTALRSTLGNGSFAIQAEAEKLWQNFLLLVR